MTSEYFKVITGVLAVFSLGMNFCLAIWVIVAPLFHSKWFARFFLP